MLLLACFTHCSKLRLNTIDVKFIDMFFLLERLVKVPVKEMVKVPVLEPGSKSDVPEL